MLETTLWDVVDRFAEITRTIEAFAAGLLPDGRIRLRPRDEHFATRDCGFDGRFGYLGIEVTNRDAPGSASVVFSTGLPDGYAYFEARLARGRPVEVTAGAW